MAIDKTNNLSAYLQDLRDGITATTGKTGNINAQDFRSTICKNGTVATPNTTVTSQPSITVSDAGLITATNSKTQSVTPSVTSEGWVSSTKGTKTAGTITVDGSNTKQLTTKAATTFNTSTSDQTIASGTYTTGVQTFRAVTTSNISEGNIKSGVNVKVGDSASSGRIKNVTGTFTSSSTVSSGQTAATASNMQSGYSAWVDGVEVKGNISSGEITPELTNRGLGTYFDEGTSSSYDILLTPFYKNTSKLIVPTTTGKNGTTLYGKIKSSTMTKDSPDTGTGSSYTKVLEFNPSTTTDQYINISKGWVNEDSYYKVKQITGGSILVGDIDISSGVTIGEHYEQPTDGSLKLLVAGGTPVGPSDMTVNPGYITDMDIASGYASLWKEYTVPASPLPMSTSSSGTGTEKASFPASTTVKYINIPKGWVDKNYYYSFNTPSGTLSSNVTVSSTGDGVPLITSSGYLSTGKLSYVTVMDDESINVKPDNLNGSVDINSDEVKVNSQVSATMNSNSTLDLSLGAYTNLNITGPGTKNTATKMSGEIGNLTLNSGSSVSTSFSNSGNIGGDSDSSSNSGNIGKSSYPINNTGTVYLKQSGSTASGSVYYKDNGGSNVQLVSNGKIVASTLPTSTSSSATSGYTSKATVSRSTSDQYINIPSGWVSSGSYYKVSAVSNMTFPTSTVTTASGTSTFTVSRSTSTRYIVIPIGYNSESKYITISAVSDMSFPTGTSTTSTSGYTSAFTVSASTSTRYINFGTGYNTTSRYITLSGATESLFYKEYYYTSTYRPNVLLTTTTGSNATSTRTMTFSTAGSFPINGTNTTMYNIGRFSIPSTAKVYFENGTAATGNIMYYVGTLSVSSKSANNNGTSAVGNAPVYMYWDKSASTPVLIFSTTSSSLSYGFPSSSSIHLGCAFTEGFVVTTSSSWTPAFTSNTTLASSTSSRYVYTCSAESTVTTNRKQVKKPVSDTNTNVYRLTALSFTASTGTTLAATLQKTSCTAV